MKKILKKINFVLNLLGYYPKKTLSLIIGIFPILKNYYQFKRQLKSDNSFNIIKFVPYPQDLFAQSGNTNSHYFHQDLLVAKRIFTNNPIKHVDIGSRIDGFVAHVASFRQIEVFDIRHLKNDIKNIEYKKTNITSDNFKLTNYCDSISSLHVIEHIGLGRYGDEIDVNGYLKGLDNIYKALKPGGKFYFSVPIGKQRIEFNAHRVFDVSFLVELLSGNYTIDSFSYVNDSFQFFENVKLSIKNMKNNFNCNFGCGIFELTKI